MRPRTLLLIAVALVAALALVACGEENASEQKPQTIDGEGFAVQMPGKAERTVTSVPSAVGAVSVIAYISESGNDGFSASVARLPAGAKGDLNGAVSGAAANTGGSLKESSQTTYAGFPARDARITGARDTKGNEGTLFARIILAKRRLIQLQFVQGGEDVKTPPQAYDTFVSSLKIK